MAKQTINLGTAPSGSGGDTPRSAFTKAQANFDELYSKAWISAADAAAARSALTLGSASVANVGIAAGNLMAVGAFGLGTNIPANNPSLDNISQTQIGAFSSPSSVTPGFSFGTYLSAYGAVGEVSQLAMSITTNELAYRFYRVASGGWSQFVKLYHSGNTTKAADGTLKAI